MSKRLFLDLETTGVTENSAIHQISGIIEIDNEVKERFDFKVRPFEGCDYSQEALDKCNKTKEQLLEYPDMMEVFKDLIGILSKYADRFNKGDKFIIVGYNILSFDIQFFRKFFEKCGDKYFGSWFWSGGIDVLSMSLEELQEERPLMPNFKLETVAGLILDKIEEDKLHTADYDIETTWKIYHAIKD